MKAKQEWSVTQGFGIDKENCGKCVWGVVGAQKLDFGLVLFPRHQTEMFSWHTVCWCLEEQSRLGL